MVRIHAHVAALLFTQTHLVAGFTWLSESLGSRSVADLQMTKL